MCDRKEAILKKLRDNPGKVFQVDVEHMSSSAAYENVSAVCLPPEFGEERLRLIKRDGNFNVYKNTHDENTGESLFYRIVGEHQPRRFARVDPSDGDFTYESSLENARKYAGISPAYTDVVEIAMFKVNPDGSRGEQVVYP